MTIDARRPLLFLLVAAALALTSAPPVHAQGDPADAKQIGDTKMFGLGLGSGTYANGLTGKLYLGEFAAIQAFVGDLSTYGRFDLDCTFGCGLAVSADYLFEFADLVPNADSGRLFFGVGLGGYVGSFDDADLLALGANGVGEFGWHFYEVPVELMIDVRPVVSIGDFVPGVINIDGGLAVRYYF